LDEQYTNTNKKMGEIITNDIKNKLGEDWYNSSYDSLFFKRQIKYGDELLDRLKYVIDREIPKELKNGRRINDNS
jgi:hypothetical protein